MEILVVNSSEKAGSSIKAQAKPEANQFNREEQGKTQQLRALLRSEQT